MRKIILALAAIAVVAAPAAQTASAQAATCGQWDLSYLQLKQRNGFIVGLPSQVNGQFNGRANLSSYGNGFVRPFGGGFIQGWTNGTRFAATIYWDNGPTGGYEGRIDAYGHVGGYTYDRANPGYRVAFDSTRNARCLR